MNTRTVTHKIRFVEGLFVPCAVHDHEVSFWGDGYPTQQDAQDAMRTFLGSSRSPKPGVPVNAVTGQRITEFDYSYVLDEAR